MFILYENSFSLVHRLFTVFVFKLFIFTVVKTKKSCFEQNNVGLWYAVVPICQLILFKLHEI